MCECPETLAFIIVSNDVASLTPSLEPIPISSWWVWQVAEYLFSSFLCSRAVVLNFDCTLESSGGNPSKLPVLGSTLEQLQQNLWGCNPRPQCPPRSMANVQPRLRARTVVLTADTGLAVPATLGNLLECRFSGPTPALLEN